MNALIGSLDCKYVVFGVTGWQNHHMPTREQIDAKVASSMLLNVAAGMISSLVIYVSLTEIPQIFSNWPFVGLLLLATGVTFEWAVFWRTGVNGNREGNIMDLKFGVVALVLVFAGAFYARAMRRSHAGWGEIVFPWGYVSRAGRRGGKRGRKGVPAE